MEMIKIWEKEDKKRAYVKAREAMKLLGWDNPKPRFATKNGKSVSFYSFQKLEKCLSGTYYDMVSGKWVLGNRLSSEISSEELELIKTKVMEDIKK